MSNKECYHEGITSRVTDSQIHGVGDPRSEGSIKESELNGTNTIRGQIEFIHKVGIYKTMGGAAIYESGRSKRGSGRERNGYKQGVRLGESGCVEPDRASSCTARVSAAPRRYEVRGAAHSFACLAGSVDEAFPLAEFLVLGQSVTLCPALPQKRQS